MEFTDTIIKSHKLKSVLRITFLFLFIVPSLFIMFFGYSFVLSLIIILGLIGLLVISILTAKLYNWAVLLFIIIFLGFSFKGIHWPLAGLLMTVGTGLLALISLSNSKKILFTFTKNSFLRSFGCLSGVIVVLFMTGLLFMNQNWSGIVRNILIYSGSFLFVISVLAFVFTLPNSNYITWSMIERKVFFRTVLTPMIFIFALFTLVFVFNDTYNVILGRVGFTPPWYYNEVILFDLEGIPFISPLLFTLFVGG